MLSGGVRQQKGFRESVSLPTKFFSKPLALLALSQNSSDSILNRNNLHNLKIQLSWVEKIAQGEQQVNNSL